MRFWSHIPESRNTTPHYVFDCNTLQHTATYCNTLQHATTHYYSSLRINVHHRSGKRKTLQPCKSLVSALEMWRGRWQIWRSMGACTQGTPIPSARVFFDIPAGDTGNPSITLARCLVGLTCSISNLPACSCFCVDCSFVLALHQQHRPHNTLGLSV